MTRAAFSPERESRLACGAEGKNNPLDRHAAAGNVAETACALCAHSPFITGQTVVVDGGRFIGL